MRKSCFATILLSAFLFAILASSFVLAQPGPPAFPRELIVMTDKGQVQGMIDDLVENFFGIPYAAPPTKNLRWQPPQPAARWEGVRSAEQYGNVCPQGESIDAPRTVTEDCLFLNVQRPIGTQANAKLPVFVYIHGGGLTGGGSDNEKLNKVVRDNRVIGVAMNYRLGALGFFAHAALSAQDGESGNYGLMDQQAALRWVQDNIAAFGGDPAQVTIAGESAGGWSVCSHLAAPSSRGLFARAMIQSGGCDFNSLAEAETSGEQLAAELGCADADAVLVCLRNKSVAALIDAKNVVAVPAYGTAFLPTNPRVAVNSGDFTRVPVVIGGTRDEGRAFSRDSIGWTQADYTAWVRADPNFGSNAEAVLSRYAWPATASEFTPAYLVAAVITDSGTLAGGIERGVGACTNRVLAQDFGKYVPTYAYEFAHRGGPNWFDVLEPKEAYVGGAGHAVELPYLFPERLNGLDAAEFTAAERQLADELTQYWGSFVKTGDPQVAGQTPWPRYNAQRSLLALEAGGQSVVMTDAVFTAEHHCDLWDDLASKN